MSSAEICFRILMVPVLVAAVFVLAELSRLIRAALEKTND